MNRTMSTLTLLGFILLVLGVSVIITILTPPGEWYEQLRKPSFTPPNWVFGPVWGVLYIMIAVSGWRVWREEKWGLAMRLWALQLVVNWMWPPVFLICIPPGWPFSLFW